MKEVTKASSFLAVASVGEMAMRFVRTKSIALILGTAGTGLLAPLVIFFETLRIWGSLGTRRAVIRQIAECRKDGFDAPRYRQLIHSSFVLVIFSSVLLSFLTTIFSKLISRALYGDPSYYLYVVVIGLILPTASVSALMASILKGNLQYRSFAKYTLMAYLGVIVLTPMLVYFFKYGGALFVHFLFFACPLFSYLLFNTRQRFLYFSKRFDFKAIRDQLLDGFNNVYSQSFTNITKLVIATWITKKLGLSEMGIYQVVITFTTVYMTIPIQSVSGYTLPIVASAQNNREIVKAINDTMRFLIFALAPVIVMLMIWPELFIHIFYTSDFFHASPILRLQLVGTLCGVLSHACGSSLVAKGRLKALYVATTVQPLIFFGLAWALFGQWKLMGVAFAFSAASLCGAAVYLLFVRKYYEFRFHAKNKRLMAATVLWMALALVESVTLDHWVSKMLLTVAGIAWFYLSSKGHERAFLWGKLKAVVGR